MTGSPEISLPHLFKLTDMALIASFIHVHTAGSKQMVVWPSRLVVAREGTSRRQQIHPQLHRLKTPLIFSSAETTVESTYMLTSERDGR